MNIIRPILAAATHASERLVAAPGVFARLILLWLLCSALPCLVIVALVVVRSNGWLIPKTASVEIAVLVVALAAVLLGLPTMILTSRSISDPIGEVVDAMAEVEQGISTPRWTSSSVPKSAGCKADSTGWSPDWPSASGCATCSAGTSAPTSRVAPSKKAHRCRVMCRRRRSCSST